MTTIMNITKYTPQEYEQAKRIVFKERIARTSLLQRRMNIDYIKARVLMEALENRKVITRNIDGVAWIQEVV